MPSAVVRLYAELNDFLGAPSGIRDHRWTFPEGSTIREILGAHGVPEAHIDLVLVNGESSTLDRMSGDGDRISVFPVFESFDIRGITKIPFRPLRQPRFVLDVHLGKLSSHLRMLGFDAVWGNPSTVEALRRISIDEERTLLSRNRMLIASPGLTRAYLVRSVIPMEQIVEVVRRFDLARSIHPFTRCIRCNCPVLSVSKLSIIEQLQPRTLSGFQEFFQCPCCRRITWRGGHVRRMEQTIELILRRVSYIA